MGEENKEHEKKEESSTEEKQAGEEKMKEDQPQEIVLKVDMHCAACARKVARALKGFAGVEEVTTDSKASKVVVKGKAADPIKVCERLQKKSGKKLVEIISPLPKPSEETKEEKIQEIKEEIKKEEQPPAVITVVLKVRMHCEACAQVLQKQIRKIKGVESVETDLANDQVIVKGVVEPTRLVDYVYKRTKKQASIVKDEEKKEEEKKEDKEEEKKDGEEEGKGEDDMKISTDIKRSEYWPTSKYLPEYYAYPAQIFSDDNPNACSIM